MEQRIVRFDGFDIDLTAREVRRGTVRLRLQEQPFQILAMMLERPGGIVTRDEIRLRLWPDGTIVDFEHSVNAAVKRLRAALGDAADCPRYIETLHRRGYRFIATVDRQETPAAPPLGGDRAAAKPRLIVLPFTNLSDDPAQDYFSDGLTEEMIAQLGRRCAHRLGVLARTTSLTLKDTPQRAREIGASLRADYLVEGSVRRDKDRVRITAQLIETRGETHLWAQSYDREVADVLAVQTEVAARIAASLAGELLADGDAAVRAPRTPDAYQAYLKGRFYWNKSGPGGLETAIAFYDEALALDPRFGAAHSSRARAWVALSDYYVHEPRVALGAARAAAERALALDPADAEAHVAIAEVRRTLDWDWRGAESSYRAGLASNPSHDATMRYYGLFLAARGQLADARTIVDGACDLDPMCLVASTGAATVRYLGGAYADAISRCRHTLDMEPDFVAARRLMAASLVQLGRHDEAIAQLDALHGERRDPVSIAWLGHAFGAGGHPDRARLTLNRLDTMEHERFVPAFHRALVHASLGEADAAFALLERACDQRDPALDTLGVEPRFNVLRGDPRYAAMLGRLQLGELATK